MNIQFEVQKIHSQFGTTEMANYQTQKLFDKLIKESVDKALKENKLSNPKHTICTSEWHESDIQHFGFCCVCKLWVKP